MVSADYLVVRIVVGRVVVVILSSVGLLGCGDKTLFSRNCSVAWRDTSTFPQWKHAPKVSIKWRVHRIMFPLVLLMPEWSSRYYLSLPPSSGNPPLSRCYGASRKGEGMDNRRWGGRSAAVRGPPSCSIPPRTPREGGGESSKEYRKR